MPRCFVLRWAGGWTDGTAPRTNRPQSPQVERKEPEPSKRPQHNPATLWSDCKPAAASHEYIARKLGLPHGLAFIPVR